MNSASHMRQSEADFFIRPFPAAAADLPSDPKILLNWNPENVSSALSAQSRARNVGDRKRSTCVEGREGG